MKFGRPNPAAIQLASDIFKLLHSLHSSDILRVISHINSSNNKSFNLMNLYNLLVTVSTYEFLDISV